MTLEPIPDLIRTAVLKEMKRLDWPECVPSFAEMKTPTGTIFKTYETLTVGDCEQLVEHHKRAAWKAIDRFKMRGGSKSTATTAAKHIVRANVYRCRYLTLMNVDDPPISEFPFPFLSEADAEQYNSETDEQ